MHPLLLAYSYRLEDLWELMPTTLASLPEYPSRAWQRPAVDPRHHRKGDPKDFP